MGKTVTFLNSSIGQKLLVGLTGFFLCSFLMVHMSGNLLLFSNDGGEAFDAYSNFMSTNTGIRTMEIVLFGGFLFHIFLAIRVWWHNRKARPSRYEANKPSENSTFTSRWMFFNGSIVAVFLAVHFYNFFIPARFGAEHPAMYGLVQEVFANPLFVAFYLVALLVLAFHLKQGFQSAFQTFGIRPGWQRPIDYAAAIFWLVIPLGFASMPLYFYLTGSN
jgi:succinate dehydrogenase / fumarate reductase cytochrome b subunit